jgi:autotransporter-associated beta strand protein
LGSVFDLDRAILRAILVLVSALAVIGATMDVACAQQFFNGAQTTPNATINGGSGVWDNTTTNWTNATGTVSNPYDPTAATTTVFGASGSSTPATGGTVSVGAGGVQLTGDVQFQATGDNSIYTIQGGNLTVAAGGTFFEVGNVSGSFVTPSAIISSSIVGTDGISVFGPGTLVLNGASTYTGGTFICSCASLQLGDATHTGSIVGAVTNEGTFRIVNAKTAGITSILNDFGGFTRFLNTSSASSINIMNSSGGTTFFGRSGGTDTSTAANATIDNNDGGTIFQAHSNAGAANITNHDGGGTVFLDNASAASATITNNNFGFVVFNDLSTAGSATIITNSGGGVAFFDRSTGGNAQFITNGTGVVDFSQSAGPHNDGVITAGSIAGSGTYVIGGTNTLVVGSNNLSTEVSGVIADSCGCGPSAPGNLEKVGTGTLTLSGTNNTYTGDTLVNGGTLLVTGSIASSDEVLVDRGATLGGTGTVPLTFLFNGAILAPGLPTALGTLTVNDELLFCNCTFYDVKVTSTGNDLTRVVPGSINTGVANLEGTVRVTSLNSTYKFNSPYTILTAQGGFDSGFGPTQFNSLVTPTGINGSLSYTSTNVNLTLMSALGQLPGLNVNQHNVANVLDFGFNTTGSSGNLGAIFNGNIPQNLTQVSGELPTGSQQATFQAMNLFLGLLTDPFVAGRDGGVTPGGAQPYVEESEGSFAYAAKKQNAARAAFARIPTKADAARNDVLDPRWSVWGSAYGGGANIDGNAALGSNSADVRAFGFAAGADYRISPSTLAGFALAGGATSFSVNGFGIGRSDLFQAGAFVRHTIGAAYVTGALAYGWQQVTTDRTVTVAGFDRLHAQFNANAVSGRLEGGTRFAMPWMGVTPYAAGQFTILSLPAYGEQALVGTNAFALNYAAQNVTAARTELGVRTDRSFALQSAILTLRGRFAWAHDFNTDRNITAVFQALPGASFVVGGAAQAHDSALTTVSAEMKWLNGWSAAASFEGEFSGISRSYAGKGVLRYAW